MVTTEQFWHKPTAAEQSVAVAYHIKSFIPAFVYFSKMRPTMNVLSVKKRTEIDHKELTALKDHRNAHLTRKRNLPLLTAMSCSADASPHNLTTSHGVAPC